MKPKIIRSGTLYAVVKLSSTLYAVTLASDHSRVQRTGGKEICLLWQEENDESNI